MTRNGEHRRFRKWLSLDVDGRLQAGVRSSLEAHLAACAECRREREALVVVRAECESAERVAASPSFVERVMAALGRERLSPWLEALPLLRGFAAVGFAVCVVCLGLLWLGPTRRDRTTGLPMGQLDPLTERLFETGSVPPEMLPPPRFVVGSRGEHR